MDIEAAIGFVEQTLGEKRLSRLQLEVLEQVWADRSYQEIAHSVGYEVGYVKQTGSQLWQSLSQAFGEKITKNNVQYILARKAKEALKAPTKEDDTDPTYTQNSSSVDWGEAVDVASFHGRQVELETLEDWIEQDRCRLIGIFGMGGIGKTCLSVKLAQRLESRFSSIIWRSLHNAPPLESLLTDILQFLAPGKVSTNFSSLNEHLLFLLNYLRDHRCLIVLDNVETVLQPGGYSGDYQLGYDGYGQFLKRMGEVPHRSTVLITSREKPKGFVAEAGIGLPIRALSLTGLPENCVQAVLKAKGNFYGSTSEWKNLCRCYAGNPLALKIVASAIHDFFGGYLRAFLDTLQTGSAVFGDIRELLSSQICRLSDLEQQVMYWLAIEREPVTLAELQSQLILPQSPGNAFEALEALERRSLIEKMPALKEKDSPRFTLQPVVMEFMTEQLIEETVNTFLSLQSHIESDVLSVSTQIKYLDLGLLKTHALMKAQAKDYIREIQRQYILQPLLDRLLCRLGQPGLVHSFQVVLAMLRHQPASITSYVAGNILNFLAQLSNCWEGWDFSYLTVWQAHLTSVNLHRCNFQSADLSHSVFKQACGQILTVAFSPDGEYLATGDVNHELHIWRVAEGKLLFSGRVDEGWIWSVAFSPDGRYVASCANRGVYLWDVHTGECIQHFTGYTDRVFSVAFSPSGRWLATGSEDRLVRIWEVETGQLRYALPGHGDEVRSVAFAAWVPGRLDHLLASGSVDGTIRLWNPESGKNVGVLSAQNQPIWSIAFSPQGNLLACGSGDRTIHLWDIRSYTLLQSIKGHLALVRSVAFSPDGKTLASGSDDRTIRLWQVEQGICRQVLRGHGSWISAVAFSPDGSLLASGSEDQSVRLWDSQSDRCLKTLQGHSNGVWCVASHPTSPCLASGNQDGTIGLWDIGSRQLLRSLKSHTSWVWAIAFSPDGLTLASGSEDRSIKLWEVATGRLIKTLHGHSGPIFSICFSPDCLTLYSCSLDGTLRFWNLRNGTCRRTCAGHTGGVWALAQSQNGDLLISGSQDGTLKIWDVNTAQCLQTLSDPSQWIRCCDISVDRQTLVSGSADGYLKVWALNSSEKSYTAFSGHHGPALSVLFAPDGQTFASCGADNVVKVWDCQTLECLSVLSGHTRWVRSVTYSADGKTLISCSQDETIRLWNLKTEECTGVLHQRRPYEETIIEDVRGLTTVQKANLKQLGALEICPDLIEERVLL
ncbi:hypothetical protein GS597_04785 [Synechococcales cyanobacterium C]|uniref:NB-ARC domain-containing protein n=1 Tax=Petrachloros mirabilis ULC683 TaxID=2781853 RepID=A0A8K1ZXE8_9CYAN|nr:NB-ARC domain-containing protein [Petrachloros mirabilis]NCJ05836.1 hypothetical protein [Petrachloros mirabilis ULC683]